jgi:hypothetical protein
LDKDEIEFLTEDQSKLRKTDEAIEEEDDMTEPAPIPPHHRVYK